jgi:dienelactone hydrolase
VRADRCREKSAWSLLAMTVALMLSACGAAPSSDPDDARCNAPLTNLRETRALGDHSEIAVRFTCEGAVQSGTIYMPAGEGPHPGVVWVFGDGPERRLNYGAPLVSMLVQAGVAVLSYDKRGVGESQGVCCPGDSQHFNLLAADAVGAVNVLRSMPAVDPRRVGLVGASQAAWVVAVAAARSRSIAFTAVGSGPTVTNGEELLYSLLTGEEGGGGGVLSKQAISYRLKQAGPSGFDPLPFLRQITVPGLWLYGAKDQSIPTDPCIAILEQLRREGKDLTIVVYPNAGHGLLDTPPSDPDALPTLVRWVVARAPQAQAAKG